MPEKDCARRPQEAENRRAIENLGFVVAAEKSAGCVAQGLVDLSAAMCEAVAKAMEGYFFGGNDHINILVVSGRQKTAWK